MHQPTTEERPASLGLFTVWREGEDPSTSETVQSRSATEAARQWTREHCSVLWFTRSDSVNMAVLVRDVATGGGPIRVNVSARRTIEIALELSSAKAPGPMKAKPRRPDDVARYLDALRSHASAD